MTEKWSFPQGGLIIKVDTFQGSKIQCSQCHGNHCTWLVWVEFSCFSDVIHNDPDSKEYSQSESVCHIIHGWTSSSLPLQESETIGIQWEFAHTCIKVVLRGYPRCPNNHDLSECHHPYGLGRYIKQPSSYQYISFNFDSKKVSVITLNDHRKTPKGILFHGLLV